MEIKKGYKVVDVSDGKLRSYVFDKEITGWQDSFVIYKVDKWVYPKFDCGPLCVVSSLECAELIYGYCSYIKIYECLYEPSEEQDIWCNALGHTNLDDLVRDSKMYRDTKLATKVKLIKDIT